MAYSAPTIGPTGLTIPGYNDYLQYLQVQLLAIYGAACYLGNSSPDYQDIAIRALIAFDTVTAIQQVYLNQNPLTAIGPSLDLIGQQIGTARKSASFSTASVAITGTPGTVINNGIVQDNVGNYWNLPPTVTIGVSGTVSVTATAQLLGNITANPNVITIVVNATQGWLTVTNPAAAAPGQPVEVDSIYRARLQLSNALPSITLVAGTAAALAQILGVTRSVVYENQTGSTQSYGTCSTSSTTVTLLVGYPFDSTMVGNAIIISGVSYTIASVTNATTLVLTGSAGTQTNVVFQTTTPVASLGPAHSITCVVEGGSTSAIAQAVYANKGIGCLTNGSTTVAYVDPNNRGISENISFDILAYVQIYVGITVTPLAGFTTATAAQIQTNIINYLNSLEIGESVRYGALISAAQAGFNLDAPIFTITAMSIGAGVVTTGNPVQFSTALTIASGAGTANGQVVIGSGIAAGTTVSSGGGTTSIVLSAAATANGTGVSLAFFSLLSAFVDIAIPYNAAAQGLAPNVIVTS